MARYKTVDQIAEIINSDLYKSGGAFTIPQMTEVCTTINYRSRMNELLRALLDDGFVQSSGAQLNLTYKRSGDKWLRKRWVSEMAQSICSGDCFGNLTGKAYFNVGEGSGAPSDACQEAR